MLKKPLLIGIGLLLACGAFVLFALSLHRAFEPVTVRKDVSAAPNAPDRFNNVAMRFPGKKDAYWDLRVAKTENEAGIGHLFQVRGDYFRGSRKICRITGDSGLADWKQGSMTITGNVELIFSDGQRLWADSVHWDPATETVEAAGHVRLNGPQMAVVAEQLTTNIDLAWVKSKGNTNTKLFPIRK